MIANPILKPVKEPGPIDIPITSISETVKDISSKSSEINGNKILPCTLSSSEYFSRMVPEQESATEHVVPDVSIVSMFFISSLVTTDSAEG